MEGYSSTRTGVLSLPEEASPVIPLKFTKTKIREIHKPDKVFLWLLKSVSFLVFVLLFLIAFFLLQAAVPSIQKFGIGFLFSKVWNPVKENYGALPVIYGTLVSSFLAVLFATPVSLGISLFLNELAPRKLSSIVGFLVEMLAAIPSVVYGLWGIFILAPFLKNYVQPFLGEKLSFLGIFKGPYYGVGLFTAGIILAIMIVPTISSICREIFRAIPRSQREAALALGATRWEMMRVSVLRSSRPGIIGAVILGLGRALGETMAVTMVIGNSHEILASLFAPSQTMASIIANQYPEASSEMQRAALTEIGLVLFGVTLFINLGARFFVWRVTRIKKVS